MVDDSKNEDLFKPVSWEKLLTSLIVFQRDKNFGSSGWPMGLFVELFDRIGDDLLKVVQETTTSRKILGCLNSTFLALIMKLCQG